MTLQQVLSDLAENFGDLLARNVDFGPDTTLTGEDAAAFQRLCVEARMLLESQLGENDYSARILAASVRDGARLLDGPTYSSLELAYNTVLAAANTIRRQAELAAANPTSRPKVDSYVSLTRLAELRAIQPTQWDLTRLVRLCEELNTNHETGCLMSVAMDVRSIVDHVPPIFGFRTFSEVANNHGGAGRSFRASMQHLENSLRPVADSHLHLHIRKREVLPTAQQVDFKAGLDALLGEVVRLLKL